MKSKSPGRGSSSKNHRENTPHRNERKIAELAYALYEKDGKPDGKAWEHWFNAEGIMENNFGYGKNHTEHDFTHDEDLLRRMKILVQRLDTGEFYCGPERWSQQRKEAYDFATRQSAEEFCQCSESECRIVVHLEGLEATSHSL